MIQQTYYDTTGVRRPAFRGILASSSEGYQQGETWVDLFGDSSVFCFNGSPDVEVTIEVNAGRMQLWAWERDEDAMDPLLGLEFDADTTRTLLRTMLHVAQGNLAAAIGLTHAGPILRTIEDERPALPAGVTA